MKMATVLGHRLVVPQVIADWDAVAGFSPWEKERIDSILETLSPGDVLYDIGAEHGYMSAIFAQKVGGENMVLVEPSSDLWPNIYGCWVKNHLAGPLFCFEGFAGEYTNLTNAQQRSGLWPESAKGPECGDSLPYRHLNHHAELIPTITIDGLALITEPPRGITIDVEGAELRVLKGAEDVLTEDRPYVWCSVHPDLMERDFDDAEDLLHRYMQDHGYDGRLLRHDHEYHWGYWPSEYAPL